MIGTAERLAFVLALSFPGVEWEVGGDLRCGGFAVWGVMPDGERCRWTPRGLPSDPLFVEKAVAEIGVNVVEFWIG